MKICKLKNEAKEKILTVIFQYEQNHPHEVEIQGQIYGNNEHESYKCCEYLGVKTYSHKPRAYKFRLIRLALTLKLRLLPAKDMRAKRICYLICIDCPISEKLRKHGS